MASGDRGHFYCWSGDELGLVGELLVPEEPEPPEPKLVEPKLPEPEPKDPRPTPEPGAPGVVVPLPMRLPKPLSLLSPVALCEDMPPFSAADAARIWSSMGK